MYMREVEHINYQLFLLGNTVYVYDIPNYQVLVGSVLLYCVLWTIVCPLILLPFVIVLSLFLRYAGYDFPFDIFKLFLTNI